MGVVPQIDNLDTELTAEQNLMMLRCRSTASPGASGGPQSNAPWASPSCSTARSSKVTELSGGMRRRLLIARGLVHHPRARAARRAHGRARPAGAPRAVVAIDALRAQGTPS